MSGNWLSIMDYCDYRGKSISTIRRYIKANSVKFKVEAGKYFIWVNEDLYKKNQDLEEKETLKLKLENQQLKQINRSLQEELAELKMLINLYENGQSNETNLFTN